MSNRPKWEPKVPHVHPSIDVSKYAKSKSEDKDKDKGKAEDKPVRKNRYGQDADDVERVCMEMASEYFGSKPVEGKLWNFELNTIKVKVWSRGTKNNAVTPVAGAWAYYTPEEAEQVDVYVFARVNPETNTGWMAGWLPAHDFMIMARHIDPDQRLHCWVKVNEEGYRVDAPLLMPMESLMKAVEKGTLKGTRVHKRHADDFKPRKTGNLNRLNNK